VEATHETFGKCRPVSELEARQRLSDFKDSGSELYLLIKGTIVDLEAGAIVKGVSESHVLLALGDGGKVKLQWNPQACKWTEGDQDRGLYRGRCLDVTQLNGVNLRFLDKTRAA
jgi:hypothetical protein